MVIPSFFLTSEPILIFISIFSAWLRGQLNAARPNQPEPRFKELAIDDHERVRILPPLKNASNRERNPQVYEGNKDAV